MSLVLLLLAYHLLFVHGYSFFLVSCPYSPLFIQLQQKYLQSTHIYAAYEAHNTRETRQCTGWKMVDEGTGRVNHLGIKNDLYRHAWIPLDSHIIGHMESFLNMPAFLRSRYNSIKSLTWLGRRWYHTRAGSTWRTEINVESTGSTIWHLDALFKVAVVKVIKKDPQYYAAIPSIMVFLRLFGNLAIVMRLTDYLQGIHDVCLWNHSHHASYIKIYRILKQVIRLWWFLS